MTATELVPEKVTNKPVGPTTLEQSAREAHTTTITRVPTRSTERAARVEDNKFVMVVDVRCQSGGVNKSPNETT